jgi:hypothetical protein
LRIRRNDRRACRGRDRGCVFELGDGNRMGVRRARSVDPTVGIEKKPCAKIKRVT